jgi:hypothetical protein
MMRKMTDYQTGLPLPSKSKIIQNVLENYIPTAIATLIEPMWVLINRLLCMLQPLEELQNCKASARKSINLNYSSLPPQLVVFKALRSRHFVLAAVCAMALLANLLAIAFAGLFNQDSKAMWHPTSFSPPFESKFVTINGSVGPENGESLNYVGSGAYHGGLGQDQSLIAESNFTDGTQLPAWTDEKWLYIPFVSSTGIGESNDTEYRAETKAFGSELDCIPLDYGSNYFAHMNTSTLNTTYMYIDLFVSSGATTVNCLGTNQIEGGYMSGVEPSFKCANGSVATEFVTHMDANGNATQEEKDVCMGSVVLGWMRDPIGTCSGVRNRTLDASNSLFVQCRPRLVTGHANVLVDAKGQIQTKTEVISMDQNDEPNELGKYFSNNPLNLIGQSHWYLFPNSISRLHADSFASDNFNHFLVRESNNRRLLDPNQALPSFEDVNDTVKATYSRLFAIWLGVNKEKLLLASESKDEAQVSGWKIETSERLFLSTMMFAIAEGILCTYAIVAVLVYLRRPGQYLARLPTCIASVIALFAASAAIQDMSQTSTYSEKEREQHLERLGSRYGYGSYVGGDGRVHIGIEKAPFVRIRSNSTWFEKKVKSFRSGRGV